MAFVTAKRCSISSIIYKTKRGYERAFLYTECDDNDLTYFILYHLRTMRQALERLKDYLRRKATENNDAHRLMSVGNMNSRQAQMVQILREKPDMMFTVREIEPLRAPTCHAYDLYRLGKLGDPLAHRGKHPS